jgi:3,4-dihydroxy-2-butanone 4-phosphate synthase
MTSKYELERMFQEAAKEVEKPTALKELTSSIINVERKHTYGEASSNNRLRLIRELIENARKKGDIC